MTPDKSPLTLEQFNNLLASVIASAPALKQAWITAETADLRRNGHCYVELIQKNPTTGETIARARATIWRSTFQRLDADFFMATGRRLDSGMKVLVCVTANYHPAYGLSLNITEIDPDYTMGDLMRIRREILSRLTAEGVIGLNKSLTFPEPALRVAVISAEGAAGYGDFMRHLADNPSRLRFSTRLFTAVMQGQQAPSSIIAALDAIAVSEDEWDCVVIIRGGGATSDLASFEDYELAANVAQFPLPVIIGIGHERDITVLDYVAHTRVKTPTAAAQLLITQAEAILERLASAAVAISAAATRILSATREQIAYMESRLPFLPSAAISGKVALLSRLSIRISNISSAALAPRFSRLSALEGRLYPAIASMIRHTSSKLDSLKRMADLLSPQATLERGYSITRVNGSAVTDADLLDEGVYIETTLANGTVVSRVL